MRHTLLNWLFGAIVAFGVLPVANGFTLGDEHKSVVVKTKGAEYEFRFTKGVTERGDSFSVYYKEVLERTGLNAVFSVDQTLVTHGFINGLETSRDFNLIYPGQKVWLFNPTDEQVAALGPLIDEGKMSRIFGGEDAATIRRLLGIEGVMPDIKAVETAVAEIAKHRQAAEAAATAAKGSQDAAAGSATDASTSAANAAASERNAQAAATQTAADREAAEQSAKAAAASAAEVNRLLPELSDIRNQFTWMWMVLGLLALIGLVSFLRSRKAATRAEVQAVSQTATDANATAMEAHAVATAAQGSAIRATRLADEAIDAAYSTALTVHGDLFEGELPTQAELEQKLNENGKVLQVKIGDQFVTFTREDSAFGPNPGPYGDQPGLRIKGLGGELDARPIAFKIARVKRVIKKAIDNNTIVGTDEPSGNGNGDRAAA